MKILKLILMVALVSACSGERIINRYYVLKDTGENNETTGQFETLPYKVVIGSFNVSSPYNQSRIAVKTKSNELEYYYYHHWAELPNSSIPFFVWEQVKSAGIFAVVEPELYNVQPDYQIGGTVHQIARVDMEDSSAAHIEMELTLKDVSDMSTIVEHKFARQLTIEEDAPMNKFVSIISSVLEEECDNFVKKIYANLRNK